MGGFYRNKRQEHTPVLGVRLAAFEELPFTKLHSAIEEEHITKQATKIVPFVSWKFIWSQIFFIYRIQNNWLRCVGCRSREEGRAASQPDIF